MDPRQYYDALRRHWRIVAASVLIAATIGFLTAGESSRNLRYQASHTLVANGRGFNLEQLAQRFEGGKVVQRAAARLDWEGTRGELIREITIAIDKDSATLAIITIQDTPERAADIVDALGIEMVEILAEQQERNRETSARRTFERLDQLQTQIGDIERQIAAATPVIAGRPVDPGRDQANGVLEAQRDALIDQYRLTYVRIQSIAQSEGSQGPVQTLEEADPVPAEQSAFQLPSGPLGRSIFVGVLGFLAGSIAAIVLDRMDTRLRTKEATEAAFGVPVLAEVPTLPRARRARTEITAASSPSSRVAEAYRILRTTLLFLSGSPGRGDGTGDGQVILVTSPGATEGKTTTVANLAATFAETGRSVIVIDCDLRRPRLHEVFDIQNASGFADALNAATPSEWFLESLNSTPLEGVEAIVSPNKVDNPAALLPVAKAAIEAARRRADIVIVDTAPVLAANDAVELARLADAVIVVARSGRTEAASAARTSELLDRVDSAPVGAVLVAAPEPRSSYYSYSQYYGRGTVRTADGRRIDMPGGPIPVNGEPYAEEDGAFAYGNGAPVPGAPRPPGVPPEAGAPPPLPVAGRRGPERPRTLARSLADFLLRYDDRDDRYER